MLHITICAVGAVRQKYLSEGIGMYLTRLKPYARITLEVIPEVSFTGHTREQAKKSEGERILRHLEKYRDASVSILDERGEEYTSVAFAQKLSAAERGHAIFVIGGALGLSDEVLAAYPHHLSLSPMTFTHEMTLVILLEQIYRAHAILKGKEYHY